MKSLIFLRNLRTALICSLLCISMFHLYDLNRRHHREVEQRISELKSNSGPVTSNGVGSAGSSPVIELPTTDGVYTNDIDANFQQAIVQTLGETIAACLFLVLGFAAIKQVLRIRIDDMAKSKTKA